ncbi:MAG TPA: DUF6404 family protein [Pseudoxanthomonas sp.]|nr:DUF6404 family protein [Pseudoxanthomonas sp.]
MSQEGTEFNVRLQQALVLLETKGLGKNNYAPPLFRLLWKFGVKAPPPHMAGFAFNGLLMGTFFGVFWALLMWLLLWDRQGTPMALGAVAALFAGTLFGLTMAWYTRYSAHKRGIPRWQDFNP